MATAGSAAGSGTASAAGAFEADSLFSTIQGWHGARPSRSILDAGTGDHSLTWLLSLESENITAVTADEQRAEAMRKRFSAKLRAPDRIIAGDWADAKSALCHGEVYDVVLADYLLGAVDVFTPYFQTSMFRRLRPHVAEDGRLYVVGLEPLPSLSAATSDGARLLCEVSRARDACILLAGHRPHREFPLSWIESTLDQSGFRVLETKKFTNIYQVSALNNICDVAEAKLRFFTDSDLSASMAAHLAVLRQRIRDFGKSHKGGIHLGYDYIVAAEPKREATACDTA